MACVCCIRRGCEKVYSDMACSFRERETRDRRSLIEDDWLPAFLLPVHDLNGDPDSDLLEEEDASLERENEDRVRRGGRHENVSLDEDAPDAYGELDDWDNPTTGEAFPAAVRITPESNKGGGCVGGGCTDSSKPM